jgi:hypothetical protein
VAALGLSICFCASCAEKAPCAANVEIGKTYRIDVLERCDENSQHAQQGKYGPLWGVGLDGYVDRAACGTAFEAGTPWSFHVEVDRSVDNGVCYEFTGVASDVPGIAEAASSNGQGEWGTNGMGFVHIEGIETVMSNGCHGYWSGALYYTNHGAPTAEPKIGQYPPVLLIRRFYLTNPDAGNDDCKPPSDSQLLAKGYCDDAFVVRMKD